MTILFSGTSDNSNFSYITEQTTPNYRVISPPPTGGQSIKTIENQKVEFIDEVIVTTPEGRGTNSPSIDTRFGKNSEIIFDSCNILINHAFKQRRVTEGNVKFINSNVLVLPEGGRINFTADKVEGMHLKVRRSSPREQVFLYVNQNSVIKGLPGKPNMFEGMWCIELAPGVKIKDTTFKNTGPNLLNWSAGKVAVRGLTLNDGTPKENSVDCDSWINDNRTDANIILFYSCKLRLHHVTGGADGRASRFVCINEKFTQKNLKIKYQMKDEIPASSQTTFNKSVSGNHVTAESVFTSGFLTLEDGKLKKDGKIIPYVDLLTEVTTNVRLNQPTGMFDPTAVVLPNTHKVNWTRTMRHPTIKTYTDEIVDQIDDIGATLGTPTVAAEIKLTVDEEYRPIENNGSVQFFQYEETFNVIVNGAMTVQDIYNKWKEFLFEDSGFAFRESRITAKNGILTIHGGLTINANINAPLSPEHLNQIISTTNIHINNGSVVAVPYADSNTLGSIEVIGVKGCKIRIKRVSNRSVIQETAIQNKNTAIITLTAAMLAEPVYITKVSSEDLTLAGTNALTLVKGVNDPVQLYSGEQVQITNIDDLTKIKEDLKENQKQMENVKSDLEIINDGVKKSSMLIPHTRDLQNHP